MSQLPPNLLLHCRTCVHWSPFENSAPPGQGSPRDRARTGECRRRLHSAAGDAGATNQPRMDHADGCGDHTPADPWPARLPTTCSDCAYWTSGRLPSPPLGLPYRGECRVRAPQSGDHNTVVAGSRYTISKGHRFPIVTRDFRCGDGVTHASLSALRNAIAADDAD